MKKVIFIIISSLLLAGVSVSAKTSYSTTNNSTTTSVLDYPEDIMTIDVYINGVDKIQLENIPTEGFLEVYSILGVKVTNKNLKTCTVDCSLNLPKGIYILKAGKIAKKIIVK